MAFIEALTGGFRGDSLTSYAADGAALGPSCGTGGAAAPSQQPSIARRKGSHIIAFHGVGKHYLDQTGRKDALRGIDLAIEAGEVFGVIGRSGAGKSTLIRTINRLEAIDEGALQVDGEDVATLSPRHLVALRRRVGMIFQHFNLLAAKTVHDNVALPLRVAGVSRAATHDKVRRLLDLVGLADKAGAYPAQLSGGQKQRVGIARALVHDPGILLCDEATSALDPETTQSILALLRSLNERLGLTIVLITHEMSVVRQVCDRVAVLEAGRIVESGRVWEVFGRPAHAATRALLRPLEEAHRSIASLANLTTEPSSENGFAVLAIRFQEGAGPPALGSFLNGALIEHAYLLSAGVSDVQGRTCGQLLLAMPVPHLAAALQQHAFEVLGYVESLA